MACDPQTLLRDARCLECKLGGIAYDAVEIILLCALRDGTQLTCDADTLLRDAGCILCTIPVGALAAVKLSILMEIAGETDLQALISSQQTSCNFCNFGGAMWDAVELVIWCAIRDGASVDCSDTNALLQEAACLLCVIPPGLLALAKLTVLCEISAAGGISDCPFNSSLAENDYQIQGYTDGDITLCVQDAVSEVTWDGTFKSFEPGSDIQKVWFVENRTQNFYLIDLNGGGGQVMGNATGLYWSCEVDLSVAWFIRIYNANNDDFIGEWRKDGGSDPTGEYTFVQGCTAATDPLIIEQI